MSLMPPVPGKRSLPSTGNELAKLMPTKIPIARSAQCGDPRISSTIVHSVAQNPSQTNFSALTGLARRSPAHVCCWVSFRCRVMNNVDNVRRLRASLCDMVQSIAVSKPRRSVLVRCKTTTFLALFCPSTQHGSVLEISLQNHASNDDP